MTQKHLLLGLIGIAIGVFSYLQITKERTGLVAEEALIETSTTEVIADDNGSQTDTGTSSSEVLIDENSTTQTSTSTSPVEPVEPEPSSEPKEPLKVVATDLTIPWDIAFLPNGDLLVTERVGRIVRITPTGDKTVVADVSVETVGEAGLLGLVLHPDYSSNQYLYLYRTTNVESLIVNRVERYQFDATTNELSPPTIIIDGIPGAKYHDGGRMAFGPDQKLYITTGDAVNEQIAQDLDSLGGKILRLNADGSIPADNPFPDSPVYSYGHRNPQGLAWDGRGRLWSTEHGPSLPTHCCRDEVNLIEAGGNYGWPEISGAQTRAGLIAPYAHSGNSETWAPGSLAIIGDVLYFGGLRGEALYQLPIRFDSEVAETGDLLKYFTGEYGRIRTVIAGPDGYVYITSSNRDGRGRVQAGDDKIIRIDPVSF